MTRAAFVLQRRKLKKLAQSLPVRLAGGFSKASWRGGTVPLQHALRMGSVASPQKLDSIVLRVALRSVMQWE